MILDAHKRTAESAIKRHEQPHSVQQSPSARGLKTQAPPDADIPWWLSESPVCIRSPQSQVWSEMGNLAAGRKTRQETSTVVGFEAAALLPSIQICRGQALHAFQSGPVASAPAPSLQSCKPEVGDSQPPSQGPDSSASEAAADAIRQQRQNEEASLLNPPRMSPLKTLIISLGLNDVRAT